MLLMKLPVVVLVIRCPIQIVRAPDDSCCSDSSEYAVNAETSTGELIHRPHVHEIGVVIAPASARLLKLADRIAEGSAACAGDGIGLRDR